MSSELFKWTDELVSEYAAAVMTSDYPYLYNLESWKKFKQSHTPKEQPPQRIEVGKVWRASGGISNLDGKPFHAYHFNSASEIPTEKLPAIKQAIEQVLNDNGVKNFGMFTPQQASKQLYNQAEVDAMCLDAFNAAREHGISADEWGRAAYVHKNFQDYKTKNANQ